MIQHRTLVVLCVFLLCHPSASQPTISSSSFSSSSSSAASVVDSSSSSSTGSAPISSSAPSTLISICPSFTSTTGLTYTIFNTSTPLRTIPSSVITTNLTATCDTQYTRIGPRVVTCQETTWSEKPICSQCPSFTSQSSTTQQLNIRGQTLTTVPASPNTTTVIVTCQDPANYLMSGRGVIDGTLSIRCNGTTWIPALVPCVARPETPVCPIFTLAPSLRAFEIPSTLDMRAIQYQLGTSINTTCRRDYIPQGSASVGWKVVTCVNATSKITWDSVGIKCNGLTCDTSALPTPMNGTWKTTFDTKPVPLNTTLTYTCNAGYEPRRSPPYTPGVLKCVYSGSGAGWDQQNPHCDSVAEVIPTPATSSDTSDAEKAIAGGVIGGILGLALIIVCLYCLCVRYARTGRWVSLGQKQPGGQHREEMTQMNATTAQDEEI